MEASEAARGTDYVVLEQLEKAGPGDEAPSMLYWVERGVHHARSPKGAITSYVNANGEKPGTFVAIPTRNFSPLPVAAQTQTKLVFG